MGGMAWDQLRQFFPGFRNTQGREGLGGRDLCYRRGAVQLLSSLAPAIAVAPGDLTVLCWWKGSSGSSRPTRAGVVFSQGHSAQTQDTDRCQSQRTAELCR